MISIFAPVFCAGECSGDLVVSLATLKNITPDQVVPLCVNHCFEHIIGYVTGFRVIDDRLWGHVQIWSRHYIRSVEAGDEWQLSTCIRREDLEVVEVSIVQFGHFGARCSLPTPRKRAA